MAGHSGHRQRRRALYRRSGGEGWTDAELLELMLFRVIPRGDVFPLAQRLVERFGSLEGVLTAREEALLEEPGVGKKTAAFLTSARDALAGELDGGGSAAPPERPRLPGPHEAGSFLIPFFLSRREEAVYLIGLDGDYRLTGLRLAAQGGGESVSVDMEELVRISEAMCPRYIVAAHNHPSGIALPSAADERATRLLRDALKAAGITLLDHLVVSGDDFVSLRENGVLP